MKMTSNLHPKLCSRSYKKEPTCIEVGPVYVGAGNPVVIAGPCAVEDLDMITETAREVQARGADLLRGGAFKPRTSPYSFRGLGLKGLKHLAEASRITGLPAVTEVLTPNDVLKVSKYADILQVGARNMHNAALLEAVAGSGKPVLLKRAWMATIEELLFASEYVLQRGNFRVILCERGIRTFEPMTRFTLDLSAVPILKDLSHLPVIVDPSHAVGRRHLVLPMALAAIAAGADGLMLEVHPNPESALSDGPQSLGFEEFGQLMRSLESISAVRTSFRT